MYIIISTIINKFFIERVSVMKMVAFMRPLHLIDSQTTFLTAHRRSNDIGHISANHGFKHTKLANHYLIFSNCISYIYGVTKGD